MSTFAPRTDLYASERPENGGTFITNFSEEMRPVYEAAIKRHGDPMLVIREWVQPPHRRSVMGQTGGSLHDLTAQRRELGPFWRIFEAIRDERCGT